MSSSLTKSNSTSMIIEFSKATQNVCMCLGLSVIFIVLFMITPLNTFLLSSIFGKVIILTLLGYTLYYNTQQTNKFVKNFDINILNNNSNWDPLKTNVLCSYIFSLFLLVLIISVIRKIF
jgi:hypothetical protein